MLLTVHAAEQVVVGVSLDPPQDNNQKIVEPTLNVLKETFGPQNLKIVRLPLPELEKNLEDGKIDIFLSTSGLSRRMAQKGAKELATMVSDRLPIPMKLMELCLLQEKTVRLIISQICRVIHW